MKQSTHCDRRRFLKTSTTATAAGIGLATLNTIRAEEPTAKKTSPNEAINVGVIGTGGRGTALMGWAKQQGCNVVALCDIYEKRINNANAKVGGGAKLYEDHHKLLDRKDVDAVIIATPDHWHHDHLLAALDAGKDIYIEKPFSKTIDEGQRMVAAVEKTKAIVQVGNHRRSGAHWAKAKEVIDAGTIGKVTWCRVWDTRNWTKHDPFAPKPIEGKLDWKRFLGKAPQRDFDAHRYFAWRWFWDYAGGLMTDIGAHQLDVVQWIMGMDGPKSVAANGGVYNMDYWETPDVVHSVLDYGHFVALFSVGFQNGYDGVGAEFYGADGTLVVGKEFNVYMEKDKKTSIMNWARPYEGPAHMANWLDCIRTRKQPNSPARIANNVITAAHLGNVSYRTGRRVEWDVKAQKILNPPAA